MTLFSLILESQSSGSFLVVHWTIFWADQVFLAYPVEQFELLPACWTPWTVEVLGIPDGFFVVERGIVILPICSRNRHLSGGKILRRTFGSRYWRKADLLVPGGILPRLGRTVAVELGCRSSVTRITFWLWRPLPGMASWSGFPDERLFPCWRGFLQTNKRGRSLLTCVINDNPTWSIEFKLK